MATKPKELSEEQALRKLEFRELVERSGLKPVRIAELAEISLPELGAVLGELKADGGDMELAGFNSDALE